MLRAAAREPEGFYKTKFHGPDKVVFDITDHPWLGSAPLDASAAVVLVKIDA